MGAFREDVVWQQSSLCHRARHEISGKPCPKYGSACMLHKDDGSISWVPHGVALVDLPGIR